MGRLRTGRPAPTVRRTTAARRPTGRHLDHGRGRKRATRASPRRAGPGRRARSVGRP